MQQTRKQFFAVVISASLLLCYPAAQALAASLTPLYEFGATTDGWQPTGAIVFGPGGVMYGATNIGGAFASACSGQGCGTLYSLTPPASPGGAWTHNVLWSFGGAGDGQNPEGVTLGAGGVLYGTTGSGGAAGEGVAFSLTPPDSPGGAWTEQVLWNFGTSPADGAYPAGGLAMGAGGVLYGTTSYGGGGSGYGTVFSLTAPGGQWTETVLWSLGAQAPDGEVPYGGVVTGKGGVLYGATHLGGANGTGVVFSVTPPQTAGSMWTETVIHSFPSSFGGPVAPLTMHRHVLYGVTNSTHHSGGTVFSLTPPKVSGKPWVSRLLYTFPLKHNKAPNGELVNGPLLLQADGSILGTAAAGGPGEEGVIFSLTPPAVSGDPWTEAAVYNCGIGAGDPRRPLAGLVKASGGTIYGTMGAGGTAGLGIVFSLAP